MTKSKVRALRKAVAVVEEEDSIDALVAEQGWNDSTMRMLLTRFVASRGDAKACLRYLQRVAKEETEV